MLQKILRVLHIIKYPLNKSYISILASDLGRIPDKYFRVYVFFTFKDYQCKAAKKDPTKNIFEFMCLCCELTKVTLYFKN